MVFIAVFTLIRLLNTYERQTNYCPLMSVSISISQPSNPIAPANPSRESPPRWLLSANICWQYILLFMAEHLLTGHLSRSYDISFADPALHNVSFIRLAVKNKNNSHAHVNINWPYQRLAGSRGSGRSYKTE